MDFEAILAEVTPIIEKIVAYISEIDFEALIATISEFIAGLTA